MRAAVAGESLPAGEVGIELTRQYYLRIIAARDGSPAATSGLQTGDYVRAIDGRATRGLSVYEGMRLLRGAPGSKVVLTIIRGNAADPHDVTLTRAKLAPAPVTARMLEDGAGYIRIPMFTPSTAADLKKHAAQLETSGAKALVIDLRRTAEGDFADAIAAARLFVDSGTITATAGRPPSGEKEPTKTPVVARAGDGPIDLPVQLLVSAGTSGPAEVFAAALGGNGRADLIGEHTIGRAGEQKLVKLPEGRGLWLTHRRYYTPAGELIHGAGLKPDVPVDEPSADFGEKLPESDPLLKTALERIRTGNMMKKGL
jgi:carboxyl-terminal processing protease